MAGLGNLIGLFILLIFVAGAAFIGYQIYLWSNELAERGKRKMEKKNLAFTKDGGLRVGVRDLSEEDYVDKTQGALVGAWNNAALPNYKSKLGWNSTQADPRKSSPSPRPSGASSSPASSGSANLAAPAYRGSSKRSTSPVPGSFD